MHGQQSTPLPPTQTTNSPACCESIRLEVCCAPERKAECCGHALPESCQCDARNRAESRIAT